MKMRDNPSGALRLPPFSIFRSRPQGGEGPPRGKDAGACASDSAGHAMQQKRGAAEAAPNCLEYEIT